MKFYIDSDFHCHTTPNGTFIPSGENLTRSDGEVFAGEMIVEYSEALTKLGVKV